MKPYKRAIRHIPIRELQSFYQEPTLDEILSDPIVEAVMKADSVNLRELNTTFNTVARSLRATRPATRASA